MPDKDNPEKQRAEEYAVLAGEICRTIQNRVFAQSSGRASGTMIASIDAGRYKFVETFSPGFDNTVFSIWYLKLSPTRKMSYFFENGSVTRVNPTSARSAKRNNLSPENLEELKLLAELVGDPANNAQVAEQLRRSPLKK
ncbi:MAG: hypothetical protein M1405_02030 [Patescibacteria group bacterium]|nr:hypothetical protein [Patescibacteria group bacterium]